MFARARVPIQFVAVPSDSFHVVAPGASTNTPLLPLNFIKLSSRFTGLLGRVYGRNKRGLYFFQTMLNSKTLPWRG